MLDSRGNLLKQSLLRFVRRGAWSSAEKLLAASHPADIAEVIARLTASERSAIFDLVRDAEVRSEVLALVEPNVRAELLADLSAEVIGGFLAQMSTDDAALVLRQLPGELADPILTALGDDAKEIESLLDYPEDSAGALMTPEYIALSENLTAQEAIAQLQRLGPADANFYVYVVDDRHHLVGVLSLRQLIIQTPDALLRDTMVPEPIRVTTDTDQEEVARMVARYDLLAIPVVDSASQLVGVITVDDVIDVMQEEATEDILKLAGTTVEEVASPGVLRGARIRFPWLLVSFCGGAVGVGVLQWAEGLVRGTVLLSFLPVILGMAGNVASQCSMVVVQGLATGRVSPGSIGRVVLHETGTSVILAVFFAASLGALAVLLGMRPVTFPVIVSLGMFCTVMLAATVGTVLPLVFSRLGVDPAVASGPFVTTSTDVLGILLFLGVAGAFL